MAEAAAQASLLPATVSLEVTIFPADLAISVDPGQVQQVMVNLFTNASQAMAGHGRIALQAGGLPDGSARLRVRDEGPGVPVEVRHRVFEALFTTKAKGSGLGLALCRRILEAHGGTIELETTAPGCLVRPHLPGVRLLMRESTARLGTEIRRINIRSYAIPLLAAGTLAAALFGRGSCPMKETFAREVAAARLPGIGTASANPGAAVTEADIASLPVLAHRYLRTWAIIAALHDGADPV